MPPATHIEIELKDEERTTCQIYSRIVGYYRPVNNWNIGKRQEFKDRVSFTLKG